MDSVMMASFADELLKIATLSVTSVGAKSAIGRSSSLSQLGAKAAPGMKAQTKMTDYTQVNKVPSITALGTADAAKAMPVPPVMS